MYKILDRVPVIKFFVCSLLNAVIWCHFRMCKGCSVEGVRFITLTFFIAVYSRKGAKQYITLHYITLHYK